MNQSWIYDENGNRKMQGGNQPSTYTVSDSSNRLISVSGSLTRSYAYDDAGNTTSEGTATFVYNDAGRMVSATKAGVTTIYALNALGQRVKKTTGGTSRYFVYAESGHLLGEYTSTGTLIQETVWFGDTPVATIRPDAGGVGVFYVHTDHLNTPRRIARSSDNVVVWLWESDPFGVAAANEDADGDSELFVYSLRFPGQYYDQEVGLSYNYYRDGYDSAAGRYTQSDPVGLAGGVNTYTYVESNPLASADSLGLFRVRAREMYTGSWNYEFEFEPSCIVQEAKDMMFGRGFGRLTRWLRGGKSAGDHLLGPRYSARMTSLTRMHAVAA